MHTVILSHTLLATQKAKAVLALPVHTDIYPVS